MMRAHDKKIWPRQFQEGELVLKWIPQIGKTLSKMVTQLGRALCREKDILMKSFDTCSDGWKIVLQSYNADIIKKYYAWGDQEE